MNRCQKAAVAIGSSTLVVSVAFPYTRFVSAPRSSMVSSRGSAGHLTWPADLLAELSSAPQEGFRPIWLSPNPLGFDSSWVYDLGVRWPIVAGTTIGILLATATAVGVLGGRQWREGVAVRYRQQVVGLRRRARFSVGAMMLGVALAAVSLRAIRYVWLSMEYQQRSEQYDRWGRWPAPSPGPALDRHIRCWQWAQALARKYEWASRRPWARIEPDPPMPE